ncbi:MAG: 50S ribosome-binding GTPase [Burkholderiaceae bacterium]
MRTEPPKRSWTAVEFAILAALPERGRDLARLRVLVDQTPPPTVTVIGKYNHGKSRLLNELIGSPVFSVADRRETVTLADHDGDGACWLDSPGLDADVGRDDDHLAEQAAWIRSDIRLFVHAAREGELDADERRLLDALRDDARDTRRRTLLVLTQIDQLPDDATLAEVIDAIGAQAPGWEPYPVSSSRHRQGVDGGKRLLLERSGMPRLRAALADALADVPQARRHEAGRLLAGLQAELRRNLSASEQARSALRQQQAAQRQAFDRDLDDVLTKVGGELRVVVDVPGPDIALEPDSFENLFRITPAKLERARLQVAYSRACIAINAVLTGHGVVGLPAAQRTRVASLDTVIVAVLGVSVKFRDDLRRLFCEPAGRQGLAAAFARYFEQSDDRRALAQRIADHDAAIAVADQALSAVQALIARTERRDD